MTSGGGVDQFSPVKSNISGLVDTDDLSQQSYQISSKLPRDQTRIKLLDVQNVHKNTWFDESSPDKSLDLLQDNQMLPA